jgi:hypothetical protein
MCSNIGNHEKGKLSTKGTGTQTEMKDHFLPTLTSQQLQKKRVIMLNLRGTFT